MWENLRASLRRHLDMLDMQACTYFKTILGVTENSAYSLVLYLGIS